MFMMSLMRQFSIRTRMLGAIGVVLMLLAVIGGAGLWGMARLQAGTEHFAEHAYNESVTLSRARVAIGDLGRHERDMITNYEKPERVRESFAAWKAALERTGQELRGMTEGDADEDNAIIGQMVDQLSVYARAMEPVAAQLEVGGYDSATVANRVKVDVGLRQDGRAEILAGLEPGQRVVTEGALRLREGAPITLQDEAVLKPSLAGSPGGGGEPSAANRE